MARTFVLVIASAVALPAAAGAQQNNAAAPKSIARADLIKSLDTRFAEADTNHDGTLSLAEIQAQQTRDWQAIEARRKAEIEAEFRRLDTNHDGQLSLAEFSAAIPDVKPSETPQQILQKYDTNHDGKISEQEYRAPQLKTFDAADANHDGVVTPAEAQAYARAHQPH